jgi:pyrroloquinoline quinone (PQQ) biosynthesis protein C
MNFFDELQKETQSEREALLSAAPIKLALEGRLPVETYSAFLAEAFHHVKHTVPLLMACGARLPDRLEWLREAVAEYIEEETGHQEWILQDIEALGGDSERVRHGRPGQATDVMVAYAWDTVSRRNPVGFFGMVLVLEGTSIAVASHAAEKIMDSTGLPVTAFRYLRSHGSLDLEHMNTFEQLMNRLEQEEDRRAVIDTARVMYRLYGDIFRALPLGHEREAA